MSVKLSICIVAFNDYEDIKKAVLSIEKHTSPSISKRLYIVDNGVSISDKTSVLDFQSFIEKFNDAIYIDVGRNLGFGKGQNYIISNLDSEYHAIVNPDVLINEDVFSSILKWMDLNLDAGMIIPYITDENGKKQEVYRRELTVFDICNRTFLKKVFRKRAMKHTMQNMDYSIPFRVPFGQGSFLVIRSSLFKQLNGFDENYFMYVEDADLCKRVNQISKLMYFPGAQVIHKWHKESHSSWKHLRYHFQSLCYYFKKWGIKVF